MQVEQLPLTGTNLAQPLDLTRSGLPAIDAVHETVTFTPPTGETYQILRTTEFDTYESGPQQAAVAQLLAQGPPPAGAVAAATRPTGPLSDTFAGTARKAAKLSIGTGKTEQFADVHALVAKLVADSAMVNHHPPISTASTSGRVPEEQRNVHVTGFLYAASREADNDFHLIVGLDASVHPDMYMTMEVSGLPAANAPSFQKMKSARDSFQTYFGAHVPVLTYDYYHPPIPVVIEGCLFFDMDHAIGQHPGPPSLKSRMPTIWEVHPVTAITLGKH